MPLPEGPTHRQQGRADQAGDELGCEALAAEEVLGVGCVEGREATEGAGQGFGGIGRLLGLVTAGALAGALQLDDAAGDRGLGRAQLAAITCRPPGGRGEVLCRLRPRPLTDRAVDAKRNPVAFGEQRPQRHRDPLGGRVERRDLGGRILAQRTQPQALGGAASEQGGEGRRALLVVMQDADHERSALGLAGECRGRLEHRRRHVVGVVEHQQGRSVALPGLGDARQRGVGDLAAAGVQDCGALALDLGRELGDEPRLADPDGPPDQGADDPALARPLPAPAQPGQLALAPGEQRRAALELGRQLCDRRRRIEGRVLGEDLLLQETQLGPGLDPDLLGERPVGLAVSLQGLGLSPGAIEGEHALGVKALAQGLLRDQRLESGEHLVVAPGGELGVDRELECPQMKLFEAADLGGGKGLGGDIGERGAAPELERGAGRAVRPGTRRLAGGLLDQVLEPQRVDRLLRHLELVAATAGEDDGLCVVGGQCLAQPRDVELDVLGGALRRALGIEAIDQLVGAHRAVGAQGEHREHSPLLASSEW